MWGNKLGADNKKTLNFYNAYPFIVFPCLYYFKDLCYFYLYVCIDVCRFQKRVLLGLKPEKMSNQSAYLAYQSRLDSQVLSTPFSLYLYKVWLPYSAFYPEISNQGAGVPFP